MKQVTNNVTATVQNDFLVHKLRHRVFRHWSTALSTTLINLCCRSATYCDGVWPVVDSLLCHSINAVINWIEVWAAVAPMSEAVISRV